MSVMFYLVGYIKLFYIFIVLYGVGMILILIVGIVFRKRC